MWYSKKMKYIFVFYPWIYMYDSCKATSIEWTAFAFKAVIETVVIAPDAAVLRN